MIVYTDWFYFTFQIRTGPDLEIIFAHTKGKIHGLLRYYFLILRISLCSSYIFFIIICETHLIILYSAWKCKYKCKTITLCRAIKSLFMIFKICNLFWLPRQYNKIIFMKEEKITFIQYVQEILLILYSDSQLSLYVHCTRFNYSLILPNRNLLEFLDMCVQEALSFFP